LELEGQIYVIGREYKQVKNEKIVKYDDIGLVFYKKNSRAKNISIRISRGGEVRVTVPRFCNFQTAEVFVLKKQAWIKKKILFLERKDDEKLVLRLGTFLSTPAGKVYIERGTGGEMDVMQSGRDYQVFLPKGIQDQSEEGQIILWQGLGAIGLKEAKELLPVYLESVSAEYGLSFKRVSVRRMKSRWGSCSPDNNISLNSALIFLSYDLIEYVILHELVHTIHKNHSKIFWDAVLHLMPDAMERRKKLNGSEMII